MHAPCVLAMHIQPYVILKSEKPLNSSDVCLFLCLVALLVDLSRPVNLVCPVILVWGGGGWGGVGGRLSLLNPNP